MAENIKLTENLPEAGLLQELNLLKKDKQELEDKRYLDSSLARFASIMRWQASDTIDTWVDRLLAELMIYIDGLQGSLYSVDEDGTKLYWLGGFACPSETPKTVLLGEGLTGQSAKSALAYYYDDPENFKAYTYSSLSSIAAKVLLVQPLIFNDKVEGVIELSAIKPFSELQLALIRALSETIGANLSTIRNQEKLKLLYYEAQEKSGALLAQEEELRQNLEELEATQDEMKRVQHVIKEQQDEFNRMANNVPGMIFQTVYKPDGTRQYSFVSAGGKDIYEVEIETILTKPTSEYIKIHPDDLPLYTEQVTEHIQKQKELRSHIRIIMQDGRIKWINVSAAAPIPSSNGNYIINGVITDITREKEIELLIQQKNEEMTAQQEELRQNLEELEATQEEMKRVQLEIKEQQDEFRKMADSVPGVIFQLVISTEGKAHFQYVSAGAQDVFEMDLESLTSKKLTEVTKVHPEDWPMVSKNLLLHGMELKPFNLEYRVIMKDGRVKWLNVQAVPERRPDMSVISNGVLMDITREKEADILIQQKNEEMAAQQEELRQNMEELEATQEEMRRVEIVIKAQKEEFERMANNVPGVIFTTRLDKQGNFSFLYASSHTKEMFGFEPAQIIDDASLIPATVHPEDQAKRLRAYRSSAENLTPLQIEYRYHHPDGHLRWVRVEGSPHRDNEGNTIWDGVISDITQQKVAEQKVFDQESRFAQMTSSMPGMIYQFYLKPDGTSGFRYVSQGADEILEQPAQSLLNELWENVFQIHPDDRAEYLEKQQLSAENLRPFLMTFRLVLTSGFIRWVKMQSRPEREADGTIVWSGTLTDMTREKKIEAQNQKKNAELEAEKISLQLRTEAMEAEQMAVKNVQLLLKRQQDSLALVLNNMSDPVAVFDDMHRLTLFNEAFRKMASEIFTSPEVGIYLQDMVAGDFYEAEANRLARVLKGEKFSEQIQGTSTALNKSYRFLAHYSPLRNSDGAIASVMFSAKDFSHTVIQQEPARKQPDKVKPQRLRKQPV